MSNLKLKTVLVVTVLCSTSHACAFHDSFFGDLDPFGTMASVQEELERSFKQTENTMRQLDMIVQDDTQPHVTITKKENGLVIALDLKDTTINDKDIDLNATADSLTATIKTKTLSAVLAVTNLTRFDAKYIRIRATLDYKKTTEEPKIASQKIESAVHTERIVPGSLATESTSAEFHQGILTVTIPNRSIKEETKKISIAVKTDKEPATRHKDIK